MLRYVGAELAARFLSQIERVNHVIPGFLSEKMVMQMLIEEWTEGMEEMDEEELLGESPVTAL